MFGAVPAYWISVGSFNSQSKAQETLNVYSDLYNLNFTTIGARTDRGFYYRVALGPYFNYQQAQASLNSVKAKGIASAWIWVEEDEMESIHNDSAEDVSGRLYREIEQDVIKIKIKKKDM